MKKFKEKLQTSNFLGCYFCDKIFGGGPELLQHMQRRHEEKLKKKEGNVTDTLLSLQTVLLQQQINAMINNQNQQNQQLFEMQQQTYLKALQLEEEEELEETEGSDSPADENKDFEFALQ